MTRNDTPASNDTLSLTPRTGFSGPALEFDFPGLAVGVAEYDEGPTGCTVFRFPAGSTGLSDVRGGAVGTVLTFREGRVDASCLAGGSVYGLEATAGVSAELLARKKYDTDWMNIAIVSGAVIYDFNRFRTHRAVYPDKALGRAALRDAREGIFPTGPRGAGVCATVGKWLGAPYALERCGQGAAIAARGDARVAVFTVVNAVGCIVDRAGNAVRGHRHAETGARCRVSQAPPSAAGPAGGNTTLTVVVTNQPVGLRELRQLARQVHTSMARAIEPFHTIHDGDVLYAVSTNQLDSAPLGYAELSQTASELAWDAVLSSF